MSLLASKGEEVCDARGLSQLALDIERDIQARGLEPGDKYLTAEDVGRTLLVSRITANRAMQSLADRGILVRARSRGTFVGPKFNSPLRRTRPSIGHLHVMLSMDYTRTAFNKDESFVSVLGDLLPGTHLHIHYMSDYEPLKVVRQVVHEMKKNEHEVSCMILIRANQTVQSFVADSGVPVVLFGSVCPGVRPINSLDSDMAGAGRLAVSHGLDKGCEKFVIFFRHEWLWGDNLLLNAVMQELAKAGRGIDNLLVRSISPSQDMLEAELKSLLPQLQAPTALLCIGDYFAGIASDFVARHQPSHHVETISAVRISAGNTDRYARIVAEKNGREQIRMLGDMLSAVVSHRKGKPQQIIVPVRVRQAGEPD